MQQFAISVIMPTYNQASYIPIAVKSLLNQTFDNWELIIINDGSNDDTSIALEAFKSKKNIRIYNFKKNVGLGAALNYGLKKSKSDIIAYLPSDDIYFKNHLSTLFRCLLKNKNALLAYSELESSDNKFTFYNDQYNFQLVQVAHRKTKNRWIERKTLVTHSLSKMFWQQLVGESRVCCTKLITSQWTSHPKQRSKILNELKGGSIYKYKNTYSVNEALNYNSKYNTVCEAELYKELKKKSCEKHTAKLKILIVGDLSYNPERVCALEEYGHQLFGLWISNPSDYNAIGPFAFGNIKSIPLNNWENEIKKIKPDIIYALLNHQSISLVYDVVNSDTGIPVIWHFKEGPFLARQKGQWKELMEIYAKCDGVIFFNRLIWDWFSQFMLIDKPAFILDGELPKKNWFDKPPSRLISDSDAQIHTVVLGRPIGINHKEIELCKRKKIHLHIYGEYYHDSWAHWIQNALKIAKNFIHLHPQCASDKWVKELSQYDAGWLHCFDSNNHGELFKLTWNDLNLPARISALIAGGLPLIQKENHSQLVATKELVKSLDIGVFYSDKQDIDFSLPVLLQKKKNVMENRPKFTFDYYVEELTSFFFKVIENFQR